MGIEKGLTDARSHPSVLQDGLFRVRLFRLVFSGSFFDQLLQFTTLIHFDHSFMMAAAERASLKRNPFHPFATFDTAALAGLALGQTVLSKACQTAGMDFDSTQAHSALYDTERTAVLFCEIVNRWKRLGGWPLPAAAEV